MTKISPKITETLTSGFNSAISSKIKNKNIDKTVEKALRSTNSLDELSKIDNHKIGEATKGMFLQTMKTPKQFKSMEDALLASGYNVIIDDSAARSPRSLTHAEAVAKFTKRIV